MRSTLQHKETSPAGTVDIWRSCVHSPALLALIAGCLKWPPKPFRGGFSKDARGCPATTDPPAELSEGPSVPQDTSRTKAHGTVVTI
eukprot:13242817-Alexandrium_andersonii.AAC.1